MGIFANHSSNVHLGIQIGSKICYWLQCNFCCIIGYVGKESLALFYPQDKEGNEVHTIENTEENRMKTCRGKKSQNQFKKSWHIVKL